MSNKNYKITAKFFFDNGEVKRVDWIEDSLTKDREGGIKQPLSKDEVKLEFRKLFLSYMTKDKVFTVENIMDKISIVPMKKVTYVEVDVQNYLDNTSTDLKGEPDNGK